MKITRREFLKTTGALAGAMAAGVLSVPVYGSSDRELIVYAWYTNVMQKVMAMYEKETGAKVAFLGSYGGNPIWWTKMVAGEVWDFFLPSDGWLQRAARSGLLEPINLDKIPNFRNLSEEGQKITRTALSYEGKIYGLPWTLVINPLTWNEKRILKTPDSWSILWDKVYDGKISMKDEAQLAVMVAALYTGQDPNNISDWNRIKEALMAQRKLIKKYWNTHEEMAELMATETAWLSQYNDGRVRQLQKRGIPVNYTVPKEGAPATIDCMAIPKKAKNKEEAHRFMDFLLRGEVMLIQMQDIGYVTFNTASYQLASDEIRKSHALPKDWFDRLYWRTFVPPEIQQRMDTIWMEVKMGG
jgi:spermidine/putrescine-binding protein